MRVAPHASAMSSAITPLPATTFRSAPFWRRSLTSFVQSVDILDPHPRRPVQRRAQRHLPLIDLSVHGRRILGQPGLDMLTQVETHDVMQVDRTVRTEPVEHLVLFVVLCPRDRGRVERIVAVADVGAFRNEALHHLEIAYQAARWRAVPLLTPITFQGPKEA
jgi:hypothetical protein